MTPEASRTRWHSRPAFLATTLLAVSALGGPFLVTRGLIAHGALFLPAVLLLLLVCGAPIVRLALASGQLDNRLAGREALQPLALLIRLALAAVLFLVGARACAWIADRIWLRPELNHLGYQARELTLAASRWTDHGTHFTWGLGLMAAATAGLALTALRKRLPGLGWVGGWLLWLLVALFALGALAGYALPGAGGLAALVAYPRLDALAQAGFWSDSMAIALLAIGAQAGVLTAAGAGLPQRANVGREARILVAGIAVVLVTAGLTGLVLLCAVCARQGIVPMPEHALPEILLLELVPALGRDLFPGWPAEYTPGTRQVALGWQFLVALGAAFGCAALLTARRWLLRDLRSPAVRAGVLAAAVVAICVGVDYARGVPDPAEPITKVLPALLALLHLTLARRAGSGMRVVSAAFGSGRAWLEWLNVNMALRVARLVLLCAVPLLAVTYRAHSVTLAGMAIGFALVWIGSLHTAPRNRATGVVRVGTAAMLLLLLPLLPAAGQADLLAMLDESDASRRAATRARLETSQANGEPAPEGSIDLRDRLALLIDRPPDASAALADRAARRAQAREVLSLALLLWPDDADLQRLERVQLAADGVRPVRLDEALTDHAAGRPRALHEQATEITRNLPTPRLRALLDAPTEPATVQWHMALVADLQLAYGSAPPVTRDFRQFVFRRALTGRSLLRPDPATAAVLLSCLGMAALALAVALALGLAPRSPDDR